MERKTVLITGGSRGIGRATAALFAQQGWRVAFTYIRNHEEAAACCKALAAMGAEVLALQADVCDPAASADAVEQTVKRFGRLDCLVNNAGIAEQKLLLDMTVEDWTSMLDVHCTGAFCMVKSALHYLLGEEGRSIINVSSMWGVTGASCETHYSTAKAGLIGFTKALAKELGPSGIRVNCVAPGVIDTDMNRKLSSDILEELADKTPLGRLGQAQEVAQVIFFLASEAASFVTGQVLCVDGGFAV